ncbi:MAG: LegC family aminotransferase [Deltaproteobacteria bacterium]
MRFAAEIVARVRAVTGPSDHMVPLHAPEFRGREWELVKDCLDTGWVSSVGSYVDRFEREVAQASGVRYGVAVVNGTAALHIALLLAGLRAGDEVLLPALTFVATANAVIQAGGVPHLVDSSEATLGLDPEALERHLQGIAIAGDDGPVNRRTGRRIAAVVPMHAFGFPVDMAPLIELSGGWNIPIVEDAAESLGSRYRGKPCGSFGLLATLSFNGNKIITTGGGGAIVTDDERLAKRAKHLTTTAKVPHRWAFSHDEAAFNYRLPNLNAALGCAQFEQLPARLAAKRRLADRYADRFAGLEGGHILREAEGSESNHWLNTLILDRERADQRDAVLDALNAAGLMARPVWALMHRLPMYAKCPRADLSTAEDLESRVINLPSSAALASNA